MHCKVPFRLEIFDITKDKNRAIDTLSMGRYTISGIINPTPTAKSGLGVII